MVTGWRERHGALPEFILARQVGSELHPAGSAGLGLDPERREQLLTALAEPALTPVRRRRGVRWGAHGDRGPGGPSRKARWPPRDAVLREVRLPGRSEVRSSARHAIRNWPNRVAAPAEH